MQNARGSSGEGGGCGRFEAEVHQLWFYHNQMSIAQDSSTFRDSKP